MSNDLTKTFKFASFSSLFDHNIKKFKKHSSVSSSCGWHTIKAGLSLCGKCKNKECKAYN